MVELRLAARYPHLVSKLILVGANARTEFPESTAKNLAVLNV